MLIYDTFPALTFLALELHMRWRHRSSFIEIFLFESKAAFQFTMTNDIVVNKKCR